MTCMSPPDAAPAGTDLQLFSESLDSACCEFIGQTRSVAGALRPRSCYRSHHCNHCTPTKEPTLHKRPSKKTSTPIKAHKT